jgi:prepilin-type N-terminal cleavage/methylation domain-containing protein
MKASLRKARSGQEGFTLIELLVVILIIGILLAVAVPGLFSQTGKANISATKQQLNAIYIAAKTAATESSNDGHYPSETVLDQEIVRADPQFGASTQGGPSILCNSSAATSVEDSGTTLYIPACSDTKAPDGDTQAGPDYPATNQVSLQGTTSTDFSATTVPGDGTGTVTYAPDGPPPAYTCTGTSSGC